MQGSRNGSPKSRTAWSFCRSRDIKKEHRRALSDGNGNPSLPFPLFEAIEMCLQVDDVQRQLKGLGYVFIENLILIDQT